MQHGQHESAEVVRELRQIIPPRLMFDSGDPARPPLSQGQRTGRATRSCSTRTRRRPRLSLTNWPPNSKFASVSTLPPMPSSLLGSWIDLDAAADAARQLCSPLEPVAPRRNTHAC